jgi:hypothetical protein
LDAHKHVDHVVGSDAKAGVPGSKQDLGGQREVFVHGGSCAPVKAGEML